MDDVKCQHANCAQSPSLYSSPTQMIVPDDSATEDSTTAFDDDLYYDNTSATETYDEAVKPWSTLRQPIYGVVLLSAAYIIVMLIGVVSNGLVISVVYTRPAMRTVTNYFLVNLATADILVCVLVLPITLLQNIFTEWWYGPAICRVAPYLQGVAVGASVNTLVAVAVERYKAVHYPKTSKMSQHVATIVILITWVAPLILFVPWLFAYRQETFILSGVSGLHDYVVCHALWPTEATGQAFSVGVVMLTCYLVPLVCIGVFYILIASRIQSRSHGGVVDRLGSGSAAAASIRRSTARLLRMLVVVVALFAISWLPLYAVQLRQMFTPSDRIGNVERHAMRTYIAPVSQWLGAVNSCVNPFIYCYFNYGFRAGVVDLIGRAATALGLVRGVRRPRGPAGDFGTGTAASEGINVMMETTNGTECRTRRRADITENICTVEMACSVIVVKRV